MNTCDDCRGTYPGDPYYTFDPNVCFVDVGGYITGHEDCTGNLCPECAGPHLTPDEPDDPRRPR